MPSILLEIGIILDLDSYCALTELAKLLQRPNRSLDTEADERMTEGELIYIMNQKAQK